MSSISPERQIQLLQALKNAGGMTEDEFNLKVAALRGQSSLTPPPQQSGGNRKPQGGGGRSKRPTYNPDLATAPYRFVPYEKNNILLAEQAAMEPIDEPKDNGLSAEITLLWTAETPILIGKQDKQDNQDKPAEGQSKMTVVTPLKLVDEEARSYILPGSSLRGMVRSVAEIIGGARLWPVQGDRLFGLRDFTHESYASNATRYPLSDVRQLKAGWLTRGKDEKGNDIWWLAPVGEWFVFEPDDATNFTTKKLRQKYQDADMIRRGDIDFSDETRKRFSLAGERYGKKLVRMESNGDIGGHRVFSGRAPSGKKLEYVFSDAAPGGPHLLKPESWKRFMRLHADEVDGRLKPRDSLAEVMKTLKAGGRAPVFFVGVPESQEPETFAMGLTRLFKVPHAWTFEQVLENSGAGQPKVEGDAEKGYYLAEKSMIDMLFGHVYEPDGEAPELRGRQSPAGLARKGRISFSLGMIQNPEDVADIAAQETIMMGPRPSFAPFYLKGGIKDYSSADTPVIAGRKRYPAQYPAGEVDVLADIRVRLKGQIDAFVDANKRREQPKPDVKTSLKFLAAKPGKQLRFESRVRLFNVTPAELGLALSALTLGGKHDRLRHMIGRAKPFGAGQLKLEIKALALAENKPGAI
ncbi:MAG: hypothetical protein ACRCUE_05915, partial [Bosea sp. (in: a-proteobacteria)]